MTMGLLVAEGDTELHSASRCLHPALGRYPQTSQVRHDPVRRRKFRIHIHRPA